MSIKLDQVLAQALLDQYESWDKDMRIWPSDLGVALGPEHDGCPLAFWHKCRDAERKELSPGQILMFKVGDLVHDFMVELLTEALPNHGWEVIEAEGRSKAFGISGRYDLKIREEATGEVYIVDFKTKRGGAFRYLTEPKPGNVLQLQFYEAAEDATGGMLLYVDREGQNFALQFDVHRDDERPEEAVRRLEEVRDGDPPEPLTPILSRRKNKGPDSLYLKLPWQVTWCSLKKCPCRENCGSVPDGIVAKVNDDGTLDFTPAGEKNREMIQRLFDAEMADDYDDEGPEGDEDEN